MAIGYLDAPPALEWREHHEQIGRPVAPVFVIMPGGLSWFRRDRQARFGNELLGRLVDADQRTFRIIRPLINLQDVLHGGHEGGAGVRGNDPLLSQMRLESGFFSVRPIRLSVARLAVFSSTTASSSSANVQRARPAGGLEQANAINLASAAPSKMRRLAEFGECLRIRAASNPSSTSRWRILATVSTLVSSAAAIWLSLQPSPPVRGVGFQQDPGLQQLLCWMVSAMDQGGEMLSLLIAQCHYVFLYRDLFPGHQSAPSAATEPSNQTNTAESMTGATSAAAPMIRPRVLRSLPIPVQ